MSTLEPSTATRVCLADLKAIVRKGGARSSEDPLWLSRYLFRPASIYFTWLAVRLRLSANAVTLISGVAMFAAAVCFAVRPPMWWIIGALLVQFYFLLDHVDGELGRFERVVLGRGGAEGAFYDTACHAGEYALYIAIGVRLYFDYGQPWWLLGLILLVLFPGSIQPWQRYCEALVVYARNHPDGGNATFPLTMAQTSSLAIPVATAGTPHASAGRPTSRVRRLLSFALQTIGFPGYFLTLLICTLLDVAGVPQPTLGGTTISYLLIWFAIRALHQAAAAAKSTLTYGRRLKTLVATPNLRQ